MSTKKRSGKPAPASRVKRPVGPHLPPEAIDAIVAALGRDPQPSISAIARETGSTRNTIYRVRDDIAAGRDPHGVRSPKYRPGGSPLDRRIVELEDEVRRLTGELRDAHRSSAADEAVARIVDRMAGTPPKPPGWLTQEARTAGGRTGKQKTPTPEVPVCVLSDWHIGETVSPSEINGFNAYDPEVAGNRVRRVVGAIVDICRNHGPGVYPGIVVNLLGDFVSGAIHPELEKTDAEEVIPSALRALDLLTWAVETFAAEFGQVYCPCASGNHGRNTLKPETKRVVYKNFDWLIYKLLASRFAGRKGVVFDNPDANEVLYRVYGQRYLAMHGDMLGVEGGDGIIGSLGPIARGETKVGKQASALGRDYDVLVIGHWHQELWLPRVIVANALKGFDEYAHKRLRAVPAPASQPLWFVHPTRGITSRWDVKADAPAKPAAVDWVSLPKTDNERKAA